MRKSLDSLVFAVVLLATVALWILALSLVAAHASDPTTCDPTLTCESAGRTVNLGFPFLAPNLCHPEECYNDFVERIEGALLCTTTSTSTSTSTSSSSSSTSSSTTTSTSTSSSTSSSSSSTSTSSSTSSSSSSTTTSTSSSSTSSSTTTSSSTSSTSTSTSSSTTTTTLVAQQVIFGTPGTNAATGSNSFAPIPSSGATAGNETIKETMFSEAGKVGGLRVDVSAAPGAAASGKSWVMTVDVNEVASAVTCTILETATSCTDTTHSASISAGDRVSVKYGPVGTPASAVVRVALIWQPTTSDHFIIAAAGGTYANATLFVGPFGDPDVTEANAQQVLGEAGTISNLYARCNTNVAAAATKVWTVKQGGSPTSLTCTMNAGTNTCNDTNAGHNVTVAAGDLIDFAHTVTGSPGSTGCEVGATFVPTTAHRFPILANTGTSNTPNTAATKFFPTMCGADTTRISTTEDNQLKQSTVALTVKTMAVSLSGTPGDSGLVTTLRQNAGSSGLTCTVASGATTCSTTGTINVSDGDLLDTSVALSGAGSARIARVGYGAERNGALP